MMATPTLGISQAQKETDSIDKRLLGDRLIHVTRDGKPAFAVVSLEYIATIIETLQILSDPQALQMLHDSKDDIRDSRLYDHDAVEKESG